MKMKRWFLAAVAIVVAIALAGCPMNDNDDNNNNQQGDDWIVLWSLAGDSHFQGLTVGETDLEVMFGDEDSDLPLGPRSLDEDFEIEAIASPVTGQNISLLITAYMPVGECWGAGVALFVDNIVYDDLGFLVGDRVTVIGEVLEIGEGVTCWWCDTCQGDAHAAPGGAVTLATTGFYEEPWDNPLNVDPIVLASRDSVGPINFSVILTPAHVTNINLGVAAPRPDDGRSLAVGMEILGQNQIRIDNIILERPGDAPGNGGNGNGDDLSVTNPEFGMGGSNTFTANADGSFTWGSDFDGGGSSLLMVQFPAAARDFTYVTVSITATNIGGGEMGFMFKNGYNSWTDIATDHGVYLDTESGTFTETRALALFTGGTFGMSLQNNPWARGDGSTSWTIHITELLFHD